MFLRPFLAAAFAVALLGAASPANTLVAYYAPAGTRPAGADRIHPTDAILPNGRISAPAGVSLFAGTNPLGLTLTPDERFAIVVNGGGGGSLNALPAVAGLVSGSSLVVVDARRMEVASAYQDPSASFFMGVAAVRDPNDASSTIVLASDVATGTLRVLALDGAGRLTPEPTIALPADGARKAFPAQIAVSPDGRTAYVADNLGAAVISVDLASRKAERTLPVGDFPFYVASAGASVLASGTGLSSYAPLTPPVKQPRFGAPAFDPSKSSSLTVLAGTSAGDAATIPMDPAPDGTQDIGGAAPGATVVGPDGRFAYVALSNVDRVAVVSLTGSPRVVRGLDLRLYPGAPYGAQPSAEALSRDGKRLYVSLAGLGAVAVLDAQRPTRYRYGLIPTAWFPSALALSADGRYLYVACAKGADGWGALQRVDLKHTSLVKATLATLRYNRRPAVAKYNAVIPPLRSNKRSDAIDHVVYIAVGTQGYDAMLGDLKDEAGAPHGNGDASLGLYPESVTPNLHALARAYALADNFYASDADPQISNQFATAAGATLYQQFVAAAAAARAPMNVYGDDPEDYARSGYLFNAFARAGLSFRDYGGLLRVSGYDGSLYHLDVPALAALDGNVDLAYSTPAPKPGDAARTAEFLRDMQRYVQADDVPGFTYLWLPTVPGTAGARDADRALGTIVDFISHTPHWSSTAIFIVPEGTQGASDHVNAMRSYALVVSPLARRGYVGDDNLSAASVVKTEEEIFGLPPLTLNDLLASDMAAFFAVAPAPETYQAR